MSPKHRNRTWSEDHRVSPILLRSLSYKEAIEFSALGLPLLPMKVLMPAAFSRITVEVVHGIDDILTTPVRTRITESGGMDAERLVPATRPAAAARAGGAADPAAAEAATDAQPHVTGIAVRSDIISVTMATFDMWGAPGFLSRVFSTLPCHTHVAGEPPALHVCVCMCVWRGAVFLTTRARGCASPAEFSAVGASVDLVSTSQTTVTVTIDSIPGGVDGPVLAELVDSLSRGCTVTVRQHTCHAPARPTHLTHAMPVPHPSPTRVFGSAGPLPLLRGVRRWYPPAVGAQHHGPRHARAAGTACAHAHRVGRRRRPLHRVGPGARV